MFSEIVFCGSLGISLSKGRNTYRRNTAYIKISTYLAKAGPTLGGGGDVVIKLEIECVIVTDNTKYRFICLHDKDD